MLAQRAWSSSKACENNTIIKPEKALDLPDFKVARRVNQGGVVFG
jgi:hypothetical protein